MFRLVNDKIMRVEGKFPFRRLTSLTFQVSGDRFPINTSADFDYSGQYLKLVLYENYPVKVDYGDGNIVIYEPSGYADGFYYIYINHKVGNQQGSIADSNFDPYFYQDGKTSLRNIVFDFGDLKNIFEISFSYVELRGAFPSLINVINLRKFHLNNPLFLADISFNFIKNDLKEIDITRINTSNLYDIIPDGIFDLNLEYLSLSDSFDLSDKISSNLFMINKLKGTLKILILNYSLLGEIPIEISELNKLEYLGLRENPLTSLSPYVTSLVNLKTLEYGERSTAFTNPSWKDFSNLVNLENLAFRVINMDFTNLKDDWKGLKSLKAINVFRGFMNYSNTRFDEFINSFYILITNEASIVEDANAFGGEYPHRFRDIKWGYSSLAFTGTKQAPQGYVQGGNNGTPANEGEKVYVLQNQYGHTITHA